MSKLKRYFQLLLVVAAAGSIYPIIYLRTAYQETILYVFDMDIAQLNMVYVALGITFIVGYLPSGYLSDRFSAKWLLTISLLFTAAGGFWFAQIPSFVGVVVIFCIWGFFSVFTFWAAHMKIVKLLSTPEEDGLFFGILDGGRGLVEALLATLAVLIFSGILRTNAGDSLQYALQGVIYMYSIVLCVIALLVGIFIEDKGRKDGKEGEQVKIIGNPIFKRKPVYILGAIIFMGYFLTWGQFFLGGFLQVNKNVDPVVVATVMAIFLWMRPLGGVLGGYFADKFNKSNALAVYLIATSTCLLLIAVLPTGVSIWVFYVLIILSGLFVFSVRGTYWSLLGNIGIEVKYVGIAIGFISFLGYWPDILAPILSNQLFANFGENLGYNVYFAALAFFGVLGAVLCRWFRKATLP
ncbi:MAG: MFS transporter [Defluviitaleaceae bacterium]|nr:MFS transporter [Defluviitaleaceae bacterium]